MNWYYIDGPLRVGPLNETEWAELVRVGKITPETLVWHEGLEKWTPYGALPPAVVEPPDFEEAPEREPEPEDGEAFAARVVDCDYPVSLGGCVSRAWAVFKPHVRILAAAVAVWVGFNYLTFLAASARLSALEMALPVAILGVLTGGLYQLYLRLMRGQEAGMAHLLVGFRPALLKPLALQSIFSSLVTQLCFLPFGIAAMMMGLVDEKMDYIALNARLSARPELVLSSTFLMTGKVRLV